MEEKSQYDESDFVAYALSQMGIEIIGRNGVFFELEGGFSVEVERKDLYRLTLEGLVISPFDDIGKMCEFIKKNLQSDIHE